MLERDRATRRRARRQDGGRRRPEGWTAGLAGARPRPVAALPGEALEAERRRIAQELHDSTGQNLAAAAMGLERAVPLLEGAGPAARPLVVEALALCLRSLQEIRTLSYDLSPPLLEAAGLPQALRRSVSRFAERSGLQVELRCGRGVGRLEACAELAIFRLVQEALLNVHRHAGCDRAVVELAREPEGVRVEVRDRGRGPPPGQGFLPGVGLRGMRERVEGCGGRLEISSGGRGTRVRAVVPG